MRKEKILIEFHGWKLQWCADRIILKALKEKFNSDVEIEAFITSPYFFSDKFFKKFLNNIKIFFGFYLSIGTFGFYKTKLKAKKVFKPYIEKNHKFKSLNFYNKFCQKKISKKKILNLKINKIYIGDILYDSYIKCNSKATIDVNDEDFLIFFKNFLSLYFFWDDYFKVNNVKAVLVEHNTYLTGIPARIAIYKKIKSLVNQDFKLFQLSKKRMRPQLHFRGYKKNFKKFNTKFKKEALREVNFKLKEKFSGSTFYEYYMLKSPYLKKFTKKRVIKKSKKFKIVIFPLSFYDAPSGYGGTLFCDLYEWLVFILKLSLKTNYDWYIKLHPDVKLKWDYLNYPVVKKLLLDYKNVRWIPHNVSHHQIIKEGINAAVTIHGTVGSEYPYFNIPVVNGSKINPHMEYNFNYNPQSRKELESIILSMPNLKNKIDKKEILEFFYMHKILPKYDWLGLDVKKIINQHSKLTHSFKSKKIYDLISQKVDEQKVLLSLKIFLSTDDYIFEKKYDKNTNYKNL